VKFLDSSVFLHAYLKPKRELSPRELAVKERARKIIERVEEGLEKVVTTVVHVAEVANIIEARHGLKKSLALVGALLTQPNIRVLDVGSEDYGVAAALAERYHVSINDALAYLQMLNLQIREVYSFDKHFDNLPGIKRVEE